MNSEKLFTARRLSRHAASIESPAAVSALLDEARDTRGDGTVAARLEALLSDMPRESIEAFALGFDALIESIELPHLQEAAWLIDARCDEEWYAALRANVLALPAEDRECVIAGDTTVLASVEQPLDPSLLYAAFETYGRRFEDDLYEAIEDRAPPPKAIVPYPDIEEDALRERHAALWARYVAVPLRIEPHPWVDTERCTCCHNRHSFVSGAVRVDGKPTGGYHARYDMHAENGIQFAVSMKVGDPDARVFPLWLGWGSGGVGTSLIDPENSAFPKDMGTFGRMRHHKQAQKHPQRDTAHAWAYEASQTDIRLVRIMQRHVTLVPA